MRADVPSKKHHNLLPDRRLARAFNFTSEDLAANRLGFMTRAQKWGVPALLRPVVRPLFSALPTRQRDRLDTLCGALKVVMLTGLDARGYRRHSYTVGFGGGYNITFDINSDQYDVLAPQQGVNFRAYYICIHAYTCRLLSLERIDGECDA